MTVRFVFPGQEVEEIKVSMDAPPAVGEFVQIVCNDGIWRRGRVLPGGVTWIIYGQGEDEEASLTCIVTLEHFEMEEGAA